MNILEIGLRPELPAREARRLRAINLMVSAGVVTPLVWCLAALLLSQWVLVAYNLAASAIFACGLVVQRLKHPHWLLLCGTLFLVGHHWCILGPEINNHSWFVPMAAVPFLVLGIDSRGAAVAWAIAHVCLFTAGQFEVSLMEPLAVFPPEALAVGRFVNASTASFLMVVLVGLFAKQAATAEVALERELDRSERLLLNILPSSVAVRLKNREQPIADHHSEATVLFADLVGFTPLARTMSADAVVELLSKVFTEFDRLTEAAGLEKIKTIGDAYMVAAGAPLRRADHATAAAELALKLQTRTRQLGEELGFELLLRIGLHSGEVVAGVIGQAKFAYDLWGDTVNLASRMESHGQAGRIQISAETRRLLPPRFECQPRGVVEVKGRGPVETFWLIRSSAQP